MNKKIFLLTSLLLMTRLFSQEKNEVENWIKEKTSKYYYLNNKSSPKRFINFKDGNLIFGVSNYDDSNNNTSTEFRRIKLSQIKKIEIKKIYLEEDIWIINLLCTPKQKCATIRNEYHWNKKYDEKTDNIISLEFNSNFGSENLPQRMGNALKDLVKLNGGISIVNLSKEKY